MWIARTWASRRSIADYEPGELEDLADGGMDCGKGRGIGIRTG